MNYYSYSEQMDKYAQAAVDYFDSFESNDYNQLNNVAWSFYENIEDKKMLKKALEWAKKSVELSDVYFNNDTLAALYYKLGKYDKAEATAKHAIELAKLRQQDYSGTQELLDNIQQAKGQ
jgi:tetratricopeptide (TPR) repeat protein